MLDSKEISNNGTSWPVMDLGSNQLQKWNVNSLPLVYHPNQKIAYLVKAVNASLYMPNVTMKV
jgi:hypothetical protein